MKSLYVRLVRLLRRALRVAGLLQPVTPRAGRSRSGLWLRSMLSIHDMGELAALDVPWWTFRSADRVDAFLQERPAARVFEWGSGASTLWLARRAAHVYSVEHHEEWACQVRERLPGNSTLLLVPPETRTQPSVPSRKAGHRGLDFARYVAAIDQVDGEFDLVVIDGRAREACLPRAMERLAPGGMVVFDNVDRARYRRALEMSGARVTVTRGLTPALPYPTRTALVTVRG